MAFLKRFWKRKSKGKKPEKRPKPVKKAVPSETRLLAEGALDYPAFVTSCAKKGIGGKERIIQHFEQLYNWYSQVPVLKTLEAHLEAEANIKNEAFEEAVVWADIMMANRLQASKKILIPGKYVEVYHMIAGKKQKKQ